ncbi:type 1 fimbrial protein [Salmonella enterica]|nr:type 1 fimbrial protein [Salmonella enterica]
MKNKIALATMLAMGLVSANALADVGGTVNFSGEILDTPCNLEVSDVDVAFGKLSQFTVNNTGVSKPFEISLTQCTMGSKSAQIKFDATDKTGNYINTKGTASNLGIEIEGYTLGTAKDITVNDGNNTLAFKAIAGKSGATDVTIGTFSAISTFEISYK